MRRATSVVARVVAPVVAPFVAMAACALAVHPGARAQDDDEVALARLLEAFSDMPGLSARFTETKRIAMLAAPLESEGEIHFAPPDKLVRRVTAPTASVALLEGDTLRMRSQGRTEEVDLASQPVARAFVDTFRAVLAGDRARLERTYRMRFTRDGDSWRLVLTPRGRALSGFLSRLELRGTGQSVDTMRMVEESGDVTVTELHDVRPDRQWTPAELRRTFRL